MDLTYVVSLKPTESQARALHTLMVLFNAGCNAASKVAFETKVFKEYDLRDLVYESLKSTGLSATNAQIVVSKVARSYKLKKDALHSFRPTGAILLDRRTLAYRKNNLASIWTPGGRLQIPFTFHKDLPLSSKKEAKLVLQDGRFYIHQAFEVEEAPLRLVETYLGVDLGIKNVAVDSDGRVYSGSHLNNLRHRNQKLRARLQSKKTKSAKRLLKKRRRKEARFARHINHVISKSLVQKAYDTSRGLALEDLTGIRESKGAKPKRSITEPKRPRRGTSGKPRFASKKTRRDLNSWGFFQLRTFVTYKAQRHGVPLKLVDPKFTSTTCLYCGCVDKKNRKSRDEFECVRCGVSAAADHVAALNIRRKAELESWADRLQPYAVSCSTASSTK